jgi:hypothetical protein
MLIIPEAVAEAEAVVKLEIEEEEGGFEEEMEVKARA